MSTAEQQPTAAEIYDQRFLPALFRQWGPVICDLAGVKPGMQVLDVGCGTGAFALAAAERVGAEGGVAGLDANPEMLVVARAKQTAVAWHDGRAETLPFADQSFDAVGSQFAFMFFEDRAGALLEMQRVAKPGATIAVAVCGAVEASPGYAAFAASLDRLFGRDIGDAFRQPFVLGDPKALSDIAETAGIEAEVMERNGQVTFDSIADLVATERACVWTLGGVLDEAQFDTLLKDSEETLAPFCEASGKIVFDMPALILRFTKP